MDGRPHATDLRDFTPSPRPRPISHCSTATGLKGSEVTPAQLSLHLHEGILGATSSMGLCVLMGAGQDPRSFLSASGSRSAPGAPLRPGVCSSGRAPPSRGPSLPVSHRQSLGGRSSSTQGPAFLFLISSAVGSSHAGPTPPHPFSLLLLYSRICLFRASWSIPHRLDGAAGPRVPRGEVVSRASGVLEGRRNPHHAQYFLQPFAYALS